MVVGGCGWLWMVVGGCGWLWVVVGGCGWLWMVVVGCGWLWVVAYFSMTQNFTIKETTYKERYIFYTITGFKLSF